MNLHPASELAALTGLEGSTDPAAISAALDGEEVVLLSDGGFRPRRTARFDPDRGLVTPEGPVNVDEVAPVRAQRFLTRLFEVVLSEG